MKKKAISLMVKALVIAAFLAAISGCSFLSLFQTITVEVTNYNSWLVDVEYRESGSTTWTMGASLVGTGESETFDLPYGGTYDFRVADWVSDGDYVFEILSNRDCSYDYGDVDYDISISSSGSVSFY